MPLVEAKCTNCGANLKVDNAKDAAICEFCGTPFVVEKAINNNVLNNASDSVGNSFGGNSADFIIRAGELQKYIGASTDVVIPNSVTRIGRSAFSDCFGLRSVVIPDCVEEIGFCAFKNCKKLTSVTIPNSVKRIESFAFENCISLSELILKNGLKNIGIKAFSSCAIKELIIPESVTEIGDGAFYFCKNLETVILPSSDISIVHESGDSLASFSCCDSLHTVINGENYDSRCFYKCKAKIGYDVTKKDVTTVNNGCYIATSVYGSYDCSEVWTLRRFRDYKLAETRCGRGFIKIYYLISPSVVKLFGNNKLFKAFWKNKLDRLVEKLINNGFDNTPYNDKF